MGKAKSKQADQNYDPTTEPCFSEDWTETVVVGTCPHCKKQNKILLGDLEDLSGDDVEVVRCRHCRKTSWLNADVRELAVDYGYDSMGDAFMIDGT